MSDENMSVTPDYLRNIGNPYQTTITVSGIKDSASYLKMFIVANGAYYDVTVCPKCNGYVYKHQLDTMSQPIHYCTGGGVN